MIRLTLRLICVYTAAWCPTGAHNMGRGSSLKCPECLVIASRERKLAPTDHRPK